MYKGTIPGCEAVYDLDDHHRLEKSKPLARAAGGRGRSRACCARRRRTAPHARPRRAAPRAQLVCGNTASMLSETWLAPHFSVVGNRDTHFGARGRETSSVRAAAAPAHSRPLPRPGLFPCGPASAVAAAGPGAACC